MRHAGDIRAAIRADLPERVFQPQPLAGTFVLVVVLSVVIGTTAAIAAYSPPWYWCLALSLVLGQAYTTFGFLAHEALHGTIYRNRTLQNLVGYPGFAIFCFSPTHWRAWHNQAHHTRTNVSDVDPDCLGSIERFRKYPVVKWQFLSSVGSGHWLSYFFFLYRFTQHAQIVVWILSRRQPELFEGLNRRRAMAESAAAFAFWLTLALLLGWKVAVFGIVVPMIIANATKMGYIATNHFLRPLSQVPNPLENSMSVRTHPWLDFIHLNFSHHVEHHLFPGMNWRYTPLVRRWLETHCPEHYLAPSHWDALRWLFKTPRVYADANTLVNPITGTSIAIPEVEAALRRPSPAVAVS